MEEITLFDEYMTLGQYLKKAGLIQTGGQAKAFLAEFEGLIFYNGEPENRRGKKLYPGDIIEIPELDVEATFVAASEEELAERAHIKALELELKEKNKKAKSQGKSSHKTSNKQTSRKNQQTPFKDNSKQNRKPKSPFSK